MFLNRKGQAAGGDGSISKQISVWTKCMFWVRFAHFWGSDDKDGRESVCVRFLYVSPTFNIVWLISLKTKQQ